MPLPTFDQACDEAIALGVDPNDIERRIDVIDGARVGIVRYKVGAKLHVIECNPSKPYRPKGER